jgi:hypothetical protein
MSTPAKPVFQFAVAPPERQRRWGVLLRLFVAIPQLVFAVFMIYAAFILTFFAWFYMIFTGRNPFFEFSSKAVRAYQRSSGYLYLLTSKYPRISLEEDPQYALVSELEQGQLVRMKVLFRVILMIPALVMVWILGYGLALLSFVSWVTLLIRGKLPTPMHQAIVAIIRFQGRVTSYALLLQDPYPRGLFGDKPSPHEPELAPSVEGSESFTETEPLNDETSSPIELTSHVTHEDSVAGITSKNEHTWALTLTSGARRILVATLVFGVVIAGLYIAFVPRWRVSGNIDSNISASSWNSQYRGDVVGLRHAVSQYQSTFDSTRPNWSRLVNDCQVLQNEYKTFDSVPYYPGDPDVNLLAGLGAIYLGINDCATIIAPFKVKKAMPYLANQFKTGNSDLHTFLQETQGYKAGVAT